MRLPIGNHQLPVCRPYHCPGEGDRGVKGVCVCTRESKRGKHRDMDKQGTNLSNTRFSQLRDPLNITQNYLSSGNVHLLTEIYYNN